MNENQEKAINLAMEKTGGNASQAAILLDIPREKLYNLIHSHKRLKAVWAKSRTEEPVDAEAVAIHRPVIDLPKDPEPAHDDQKAIAAALEKEDALVRSGLTSIGVDGDKLELVQALAKWNGRHFRTSLELIGGGITKEFIEIMADLQSIREELNGGDPMDIARESMLRMDRAALIELMGKIYDRANRASLTRAMIKLKEKENAKSGGPERKPGFSPMIKGENVQVNIGGPAQR